MSSSSDELFESMLSMLVSSGGPTASSLPPVNSLLVNPVRKFQVDWLGWAVGTEGREFSVLEISGFGMESDFLVVFRFWPREFGGSGPCEAGT